MAIVNKGTDTETIRDFREKMKRANQNFIIAESEDNSDEYINFFFIGTYKGKEVVYDAVLYTLRLHHISELYEIAEHKAAKHFPEFRRIKYEEDENGDLEILDSLEEEIGLFMAEVMTDLEEDEEIKVSEHVEVDPNIDFGIGLDAGLNVEKITPKVISGFVKNYNAGSLSLDETLYSFQTKNEELVK